LLAGVGESVVLIIDFLLGEAHLFRYVFHLAFLSLPEFLASDTASDMISNLIMFQQNYHHELEQGLLPYFIQSLCLEGLQKLKAKLSGKHVV